MARFEQIETELTSMGVICTAVPRMLDLTTVLSRRKFDLLVLEPSATSTASAVELLTNVRRVVGQKLPILFVSTKGSTESLAQVMSAGADDYISAPTCWIEFRARIAALLRRAYPPTNDSANFQIGPYHFDGGTRLVSLRGNAISLSDTQYRLASLFFSHIGTMLSRDHIYSVIWGRELHTSSRTVDTHVCRLRTSLELAPQNGFRLLPVYARGYRLARCNASNGHVATSHGTVANP